MHKSILGSVTLLIVIGSGCGSSDGTNITWTKTSSGGILTVSELKGPSGASLHNIIPGTYSAKGAYDLTGTSYVNGTIGLAFSGSIITGRNGEKAAEEDFTVPPGSTRGNYHVLQEILELESGTGEPSIQYVVGSTIRDTLSFQ